MPTDWTKLPLPLQKLDPDLRKKAFTHRSLRARSIEQIDTNERLEFLGDAVLELVVSHYLYQYYPQWNEGKLTRYRAALVRTESLSYAADQINLGDYLQTNVNENTNEGLPSYLADTFEAILGALYLDQGFPTCQQFIKDHLLPYEDQFITAKDAKDAKSKLQETLQSQGFTAPIYEITEEQGPDHAKIFSVAVTIPNHDKVIGQGSSKQRAEQAAATRALIKYFPDQG